MELFLLSKFWHHLCIWPRWLQPISGLTPYSSHKKIAKHDHVRKWPFRNEWMRSLGRMFQLIEIKRDHFNWEEVIMITKTSIIAFTLILVALLCPISALGNNTDVAETKAKLEALVDEYIACCEAKSALRNSRSENIRRAAMRSCKIAAFCRHSKEDLVEVMLQNKIEPKAYKVRHFLNSRFNGSNNDILQAKE